MGFFGKTARQVVKVSIDLRTNQALRWLGHSEQHVRMCDRSDCDYCSAFRRFRR